MRQGAPGRQIEALLTLHAWHFTDKRKKPQGRQTEKQICSLTERAEHALAKNCAKVVKMFGGGGI